MCSSLIKKLALDQADLTLKTTENNQPASRIPLIAVLCENKADKKSYALELSKSDKLVNKNDSLKEILKM